MKNNDDAVGLGDERKDDALTSTLKVDQTKSVKDIVGDEPTVTVVSGTDKNDRLVATSDAEAFNGGDGTRDRVDYRKSKEGVVASLLDDAGTGGGAAGDTYTGIEGLLGSRHQDYLQGDDGRNVLSGRAGDDVLYGMGGNDRLHGGTGSDRLFGGDGNDTLVGGAGADMLVGGVGTDSANYHRSDAAVTINLAAGTASGGHADGDVLNSIENLVGSRHDDVLIGDDGDNRIAGRDGDDEISGGAGDDRLLGGKGDDVLDGGTGNDRLHGGQGADTLTGGEGNDRLHGGDGNDQLMGGAGNDRLHGGNGIDVLNGGDGDDWLNGGAGADVLDGGDGVDRATYGRSSEGVTVDLMFGLGSGGEAEGDRLLNIENLSGSKFDDVLTGNLYDNRIWGNDGDDVISGFNGNDRLHGGRGDDIISGDEGNDRIGGGDGEDALFGGSGDDRLFGGNDNDILNGGEGADRLNGGAGDRDAADYINSTEGVDANLTTRRGSDGEAEGDRYFNIEFLYGSNFDDTLTGDAGVNRLVGREGDDVLNGMAGDDILRGGEGADVLIGGDGDRDAAEYGWSEAGVTVNLTTNVGLGGEAEGDTFDSIEYVYGSDYNDDVTGDAAINRLIGDAGDDALSGMGGNDYLLGGVGNDSLTGGEGDDVFQFEAGFGNDVITDFEAGTGRTDRIWLRENDFGSVDDLFAAMEQTEEGVVLTVGSEGTVTLLDMTVAELVADDFII